MQISDYLDQDDIKRLTAKSDLQASRLLIQNWLIVGLLFWLVTAWTNPFSIALALVLLAGQQLGLSVIMHECGHNTFFTSRRLNQFFGQYFAANPTFGDLHGYARGHTVHHQKAGTADDPDLPNYQAYPVSKASFQRKVIRDLTGQTGFKLMSYVFASAAGVLSGNAEKRHSAWPFAQQILVNIVLAVILGLLFAPWAYLLWFGSLMTIYMLIVRIRQVAEHANVPNALDRDPRQNTRTTLARWWERLVFAPNYVNYHMEHHFMASVPCYKLPALRQLLLKRGALDDVPVFSGYGQVLRHAVI